MYKNKPCTLIDVDEAKKIVRIKNYVDNVQFTAFGSNTEPSIADYEDFWNQGVCQDREIK